MAAKNVQELLVELRAGEDKHTLLRMEQAWEAATKAVEARFTYAIAALRDLVAFCEANKTVWPEAYVRAKAVLERQK